MINIEEFMNIFRDCETSRDKVVIKSNIADAVSFVKEKYGFDMLKEIFATDKKDMGIELNYRLYSTEDEEEVILSAYTKDEMPSVSGIFDSATADEKEIYDLFGVKFIGNNELKRLYMPEDFEGHPLRKDYVLNNDED